MNAELPELTIDVENSSNEIATLQNNTDVKEPASNIMSDLLSIDFKTEIPEIKSELQADAAQTHTTAVQTSQASQTSQATAPQSNADETRLLLSNENIANSHMQLTVLYAISGLIPLVVAPVYGIEVRVIVYMLTVTILVTLHIVGHFITSIYRTEQMIITDRIQYEKNKITLLMWRLFSAVFIIMFNVIMIVQMSHISKDCKRDYLCHADVKDKTLTMMLLYTLAMILMINFTLVINP